MLRMVSWNVNQRVEPWHESVNIQGYPEEVATWMKSLKHRQHNWLGSIAPH